MATAPASFRREAIINVDGTISATFGEHKQGMDISYNGQWGYHPLVVSLQTKAEHLCHFTYRPTKCKKTYRMIVLRKQLKVIKGEMYLFNNDWHRSSADMIQFYRNRADHESEPKKEPSHPEYCGPAADHESNLTDNGTIFSRDNYDHDDKHNERQHAHSQPPPPSLGECAVRSERTAVKAACPDRSTRKEIH
jgi:hypothetical protein